MSKHTPGPWTVCEEAAEFHEIHRPESVRSKAFGTSDQMGDYRGIIICTFTDAHGNRPHAFAECDANARLIAAAPAYARAWALVPDDIRQRIFDALHTPADEWIEAAIGNVT